MVNPPQKTIRSVQYLRAFAALAVVYYHIAILDFGKALGLSETGDWGVDVFFVISGFIMGTIVVQDSSAFLTRRIMRIVPLYWVATLGWAGLALLFPAQTKSTVVDLPGILKSLFFIPYELPLRIGPILGLGWTLNYEMFFYLLIAFSLWVFKDAKKSLLIASGLLVALVVSGVFYSSAFFPLTFYQAPILLEFVAGIWLAFAYRHFGEAGQESQSGKLARVIFGGVALVAAFIWLTQQSLFATDGFFSQRAVFYGIPAFLMVLGALAVEPVLKPGWFDTLCLELGAGSYAIYLFHAFTVGLLGPSFFGTKSLAENYGLSLLIMIATMVFTAFLGIAINKWVDTPLQRKLKQFIYRPGKLSSFHNK
ncbi:acyltransferase [Gleimia sp. 6138-11-ORH1]|uniref:acyltransferase family protein n=1 Tax=Gleimia sp. 6138-11-ORH1 TaxID=2973937 RepID=UPI002169A44F|nr:acyltransferase [Gleimia sp. 6138-11-ORH1]MCS4484045.1 acyltransferase [Gleimia sp. 6138-11-ORH1]